MILLFLLIVIFTVSYPWLLAQSTSPISSIDFLTHHITMPVIFLPHSSVEIWNLKFETWNPAPRLIDKPVELQYHSKGVNSTPRNQVLTRSITSPPLSSPASSMGKLGIIGRESDTHMYSGIYDILFLGGQSAWSSSIHLSMVWLSWVELMNRLDHRKLL